MVVVTGLAKRLTTFFTGLLECMGFAGVIFGWASLVFVLKEEKYFAHLCNTTGNASIAPIETDCSAQDERFSLIFTIASFLNNFMTLPNGVIFDRFGTLVTRLIGITVYTFATLLVAFSSAASAWLLFPAASLLAIGGILFVLTNMQVGNLFGRHKSTIITLYNGAFDSSSAVFLLVKVLFEHGLSLMSMFLFISCCSVFHLLRTFFLMPRGHIPYPLPENYSYGLFGRNSASSSSKEGNPNNQEGVLRRGVPEADVGQETLMDKDAVFHKIATLVLVDSLFLLPLVIWWRGEQGCPASITFGLNRVTPAIDRLSSSMQSPPNEAMATNGAISDSKTASPEPPEATFRSCACSWLFTWHLVWLSVMQLRHYLFIGTLNPMLSHLAKGDQKQISLYTNAFAFTQFCGVFCAPWNGMIMDRHKRGKKQDDGTTESNRLADLRSSVLSLALTAVQCVLFSICAAIPTLPVQYATFIFQVVNRAFLYGGNAAFIALAFPLAHFGKLYGLVMALSAVVSILQYPCFALVKDVLAGDPFYVNIGLLMFILLAFIHPINVFLECRRREASLQTQPTTPAGVLGDAAM